MSGSVDINVPLSGHQFGSLGVGQSRGPFERTRARRNRHSNAGNGAELVGMLPAGINEPEGFCRPVEMGHRSWAGKAGIFALPCEFFARAVVCRRQRAGTLAVVFWHFVAALKFGIKGNRKSFWQAPGA